MAGKIKPMSQIKQLLRLYQMGESKKGIARALSLSRNTVRSYLDQLSLIKLSIDELLALDDPILESVFHAGNPSYKANGRYDRLKANLPLYKKELSRTGVTKHLLWEEYRASEGKGYSRSQFCYHLNQMLKSGHPSLPLQHEPGRELYIDFAGKKFKYFDRYTGEEVGYPVFVACLPYSDQTFAMAVPNQSTESFLYALSCCLRALGGVPKMLVPDNLKSAIEKASPYEPEIGRAMEDFANHYNTTVVPARVAHPRDKALVEDAVKQVYRRIYARLRNASFGSLDELNQAIAAKCRNHNQTRMQNRSYCREERFLAEEQALLGPLPETDFELKHYRTYTVAKNNCIFLCQDKRYYSVPYQYIGTRVKVIYTRRMVWIYSKENIIATHPREFSKDLYTLNKNHLCSSHQHYLDRSPSYYINKAKATSVRLGEFFTRLFADDDPPERKYRSCDGVLSLARKTPPDEFAQAVDYVMEHGLLSYRHLLNVIKNRTVFQGKESRHLPLPPHSNVRGKEYYSQTHINF